MASEQDGIAAWLRGWVRWRKMVRPLDDPSQQEGSKLISALTEAGIEIYASFWTYRAALGEWRLIIASPAVGEKGPRAVLRAVKGELAKTNGSMPFGLLDIDVYNPQEQKYYCQ